MEFTIVDAPDAHRYEARTLEDEVAGYVDYELEPGVANLTHTKVEDAHEGQGVGGRLARGALDDVRTKGLQVRPQCSFIASWIDKHPDYADLVVPT